MPTHSDTPTTKRRGKDTDNQLNEENQVKPLQQLVELELAYKRHRYPNVPLRAIVKPKFEDKTSNGLTHCVIRWFVLHGWFSTRLASTGTYRNDLQKFVPSRQISGLPDVMAVVNGRLSDDQKATITQLQASGALVLVATNFDQFYTWFCEEIKPLTNQSVFPSRVRHPIPRLATPDLPWLQPTASERKGVDLDDK